MENGDLEHLVTEIWRDVLRLERLGQDDNFFERGGSSLLAVKVTARVFDALGVEIALREIFRHPTLAEFVAVVADSRLKALQTALLESSDEERRLLDRVVTLPAAEAAELIENLKRGR